MAQRQFASTDTIPWALRYGSGSAGAKTLSSSTIGSADGAYYGTITGTGNTTTGATNLSDGTYNLICKIIQLQGTGASISPNWEFNFLKTVSGGVATFSFPLIQTYNTGAKIITAAQYLTISLPNGVTLLPQNWDGNVGGEIILFAAQSFIQGGSGIVSLNGANGAAVAPAGSVGPTTGGGFRGGKANNGPDAGSGDGYLGNGSANNNQNGNGGGGGNGSAGGGGGSAVAGGDGAGSANLGGLVGGNSSLTWFTLPGGGGGGQAGNGVGAGGSGAATITIVSRKITMAGSFNGIGGAGGSPSNGRGGGGAAGANGLLKGQIIDVSNSTINFAGGAAGTGPEGNGGSGGAGFWHVDYGVSYNTTGASITAGSNTSTKDTSLVDPGPLFFLA